MYFDEIFASAVSDRPSEQWFKKSNFGQLQSPFLIKLKSNLINLFFLCYKNLPTRNSPGTDGFNSDFIKKMLGINLNRIL
jgi:hypothetical protein